jgi:hypothetical protein
MEMRFFHATAVACGSKSAEIDPPMLRFVISSDFSPKVEENESRVSQNADPIVGTHADTASVVIGSTTLCKTAL